VLKDTGFSRPLAVVAADFRILLDYGTGCSADWRSNHHFVV
jgi:hypothetical protein